MKALLNTFETLWCFQMFWIDLIMIDLNEKFVLSGSVRQSREWKKSRRNSSDMIPRMSWTSYMDQYRSLWRQWLLQVEVTPSTRDRNLMTLAPDGEQMNFIVRWTKTFALGGTHGAASNPPTAVKPHHCRHPKLRRRSVDGRWSIHSQRRSIDHRNPPIGVCITPLDGKVKTNWKSDTNLWFSLNFSVKRRKKKWR